MSKALRFGNRWDSEVATTVATEEDDDDDERPDDGESVESGGGGGGLPSRLAVDLADDEDEDGVIAIIPLPPPTDIGNPR